MTEPNATRDLSPPATRPQPLWRRALPFLFALGLIAWVGSRVDRQAFMLALSRTDVPAFVGFGLLFTLCLLAADAFATAGVYRATVADVSTADIFVVRGASYLPSILNHHIGQAWLTWFIARVKGASLWRMSGATLVVYATTFGGVFAVSLPGALLARDRVPWLPPTVLGIGVAAALYLLVIWRRPAVLAERQLLQPLFELGVRGQLVHFIRRLPHVLVLFIGTWVPFEFFGVHIPPLDALALVPVLMLVVALPLTPQGFGTRDWLAVTLFAGAGTSGQPGATEAAVLASTLSWGVLLTLLQAPIGLVLMSSARKRLARATPAPKTAGPSAGP